MGVKWLQPKGLKGQKNGSRKSSSAAAGFVLPTTLAVSGSVGKQPHLAEPPFLNRNFCSGPREGGRSICHTLARVRTGSLWYIRQGCGSRLSETRVRTHCEPLVRCPTPPPRLHPQLRTTSAASASLRVRGWGSSLGPGSPANHSYSRATQRPLETRKSPPAGRG